MKHVYPVRHPAWLDVAAKRSTTAAGEASRPHERDESRGGNDVADSSTSSGESPAIDKARDPKIAPDRPRR